MPPATIGLDAGSTTVKVVANVGGEIVHRSYRRHHGRCFEVAETMLGEAEAATGSKASRIVTGSAASAFAERLGAGYVHEVHAVAAAVRARFPRARTVIELGGQDAKMIHLEPRVSDSDDEALAFTSEMNERCAAGTGATLDRCLYRLGLSEHELTDFQLTEDEVPAVSAKCGVFAETDLVNLVKAGVPVARAVAALLDAIVRGNLAVLARGRPLAPPVILLGGPHAFIPALAEVWRRHLGSRWRSRGLPEPGPGDVVVPSDAAYFAAAGALCAAKAVERVAAARSGQSHARRRLSMTSTSTPSRKVRAGLGRDGVDGERELHRPRPPSLAARGETPLALGIDAGSTTVKAVVLEPGGAVRARVYRQATKGPLEDAQEVLAALAAELGSAASRIEAFGVTGYAADVLGPVLGADAAPVETLAHARAARHYVPDADVVCDVGGQDIKVLVLGKRGVECFFLSNQCAAGNGVLLEATARDLGVDVQRYAEVAFEAGRAPELTVGCAVFLDTERVTCQRDGFTPAEILAGMAAVLPRNIWENVVAAPSLAALGRVFVLSGGVQRNRAAVKAQLDYILQRHPEARVVLHPHPGEAGAIGAALIAREQRRSSGSRFVGVARALALRFASRNDESTRCRSCPSACPRTIVDASGEAERPIRFVTGFACERGAVLRTDARKSPSPRGNVDARNLLRVEASRLFRPARQTPEVSAAGRDVRIAIPRVLSMYRSAPFFLHYFEAIGVPRRNIVVGEMTSEALWRRAAGRGTVDACFPVKVTQAHVADLLARRSIRPFDVLFFPVLTHAVTAVTGCADTASCPVVAGTPLVTRAAFGCDASGRLPDGTRLVTPVLRLTDPIQLREGLLRAVREIVPALTEAEHDLALAEGRAGQRAFEASLEQDGARAIARARARRHTAIVLLARPYHADPGIHHDIGCELRALGRTTMSIRALPKSPSVLRELGSCSSLDVEAEGAWLTNSGDGEKVAAARIVASHPYLAAIEISSFKCGQDASLYGAIADAARTGGKPFLALHDLDETRPVGSLRLRLRTFLDALARYEDEVACREEAIA